MSMSMHVILEEVPNAADWQSAVTAAGFDLNDRARFVYS
jgi:hypothetical protein